MFIILFVVVPQTGLPVRGPSGVVRRWWRLRARGGGSHWFPQRPLVPPSRVIKKPVWGSMQVKFCVYVWFLFSLLYLFLFAWFYVLNYYYVHVSLLFSFCDYISLTQIKTITYNYPFCDASVYQATIAITCYTSYCFIICLLFSLYLGCSTICATLVFPVKHLIYYTRNSICLPIRVFLTASIACSRLSCNVNRY